MGLDMYLKKINKKVYNNKELINVLNNNSDCIECIEIAYWRKHSDLQGIMEKLYFEKDGSHEEFNCIPLLLSKEECENILDLSKRIVAGEEESPEARGFFWGESTNEKWQYTKEVFEKVLKDTDFENETVFYDSWW